MAALKWLQYFLLFSLPLSFAEVDYKEALMETLKDLLKNGSSNLQKSGMISEKPPELVKYVNVTRDRKTLMGILESFKQTNAKRLKITESRSLSSEKARSTVDVELGRVLRQQQANAINGTEISHLNSPVSPRRDSTLTEEEEDGDYKDYTDDSTDIFEDVSKDHDIHDDVVPDDVPNAVPDVVGGKGHDGRDKKKSDTLSVWAIVGIVVGVIVFVAIVIIAVATKPKKRENYDVVNAEDQQINTNEQVPNVTIPEGESMEFRDQQVGVSLKSVKSSNSFSKTVQRLPSIDSAA